MTDHTFAARAARFAAWEASQSPDLAQAEARIDALIAALFETTREANELAKQESYYRVLAQSRQTIIEELQRTIARLNAEIARMRTDPANRHTRTESIVGALNALYRFEKE